MALLDCHFTVGRTRYNAVVINLSMKGAFLSSPFLPPNGTSLTVEIQHASAKKALVFDGTVIRGTWVNSDHGRLGRFGITFGNAPIGLLALISQLNS